MPSRLPGPSRLLIALPLAALLPLSGCGRSGSPEVAPTTPSTPAGAATTPVPSGGTTPSAPVTTAGATSTAGTPCGARRLADGSWGGPVRMDVKGQGGKTAFTSSRGAGTLRLDVAGGKVTGGRWSVTWNSSGHAETANAKAQIVLHGVITGRAGGTASKPTLTGDWRITGTASITVPVQTSAPIDETGPDTETLAIRAHGCDAATATFLPSFNSKDAQATFRGTATWTGTRG